MLLHFCLSCPGSLEGRREPPPVTRAWPEITLGPANQVGLKSQPSLLCSCTGHCSAALTQGSLEKVTQGAGHTLALHVWSRLSWRPVTAGKHGLTVCAQPPLCLSPAGGPGALPNLPLGFLV